MSSSPERPASDPCPQPTVELHRVDQDSKRESYWKKWGTYVSDRQWGTVREDYSNSGDCWSSFPHDQARSRAYRWGEDGLLGFCDSHSRLNFALTLWNGKDPILKERLFGLTGPEGNHGEDVKELYYYLDATPTHSYAKALYKYPQKEFPYRQLVEENRRRDRYEREFELLDTGLFDEQRYFDVFVEYAKATPTDILIRITVHNRGPDQAELHLLPTLWFRNTWSWGHIKEESLERPEIQRQANSLKAHHTILGDYLFQSDPHTPPVDMLFTENETNLERLFQSKNSQPYVKDAFHEALIHGRQEALNPAQKGSKAALHYHLNLAPESHQTFCFRLTEASESTAATFGEDFTTIFKQRITEADDFFQSLLSPEMSDSRRSIFRQAYAGLLWSKQFYYLVQTEWAQGDPAQPAPPPGHALRNPDWNHLFCRNVISVPDKWEFPYFCSWDLSFHAVSLSRVDHFLAKSQLILLLREWYMHRNGQIPAYEFSFSDVNPPVHPWAVWRIYRLPCAGHTRDRNFLETGFQNLLFNFNWWVNREDFKGNNIFGGGFLGLDNIGVFDRSKPLPTGGRLLQVDGTSWMAFYCVHMLSMAFELAQENHVYENLASKFLEHFVAITEALNNSGLWDATDGFYYDHLDLPEGQKPLKVRSIVGFVPLLAATILRHETLVKLPEFLGRSQWFLKNVPQFNHHLVQKNGDWPDQLLSVPTREQLERMLKYLFDEEEFLSPYGIRSVSKWHEKNPFNYWANGQDYQVNYEPGESTSTMFGGNSNWRGPIWFPLNFLILESLRVYHHFYGDSLKVEFPTRSGNWINLGCAARHLAHRLISLFDQDANGRRPCHGDEARYAQDPHWKDLVLFNEYYQADSGRGCGASHQTGWTALVADLLSLEDHWE